MDSRPALLIVDPMAQRPYTLQDLHANALGGTEATVLRVCKGLAEDYRITILQSALQRTHQEGGLRFAPFDPRSLSTLSDSGPLRAIVVVRADKVLSILRKIFPITRIYLWMHCYPGRHKRDLDLICEKLDVTMVVVSSALREAIAELCGNPGVRERTRVIYNPVDDALVPDGSSYDANKLLFLSSPHKGLDQVIDNFSCVRRELPQLELHIANPGYLDCAVDVSRPGIRLLGTLPHERVMGELKSALCLFYPQSRFPETFGLVFAEANAVGTPVLAHPLGAAEEVLDDDRQTVNANDPREITNRMRQWHEKGRPEVKINPRFYLSNVLDNWKALLT